MRALCVKMLPDPLCVGRAQDKVNAEGPCLHPHVVLAALAPCVPVRWHAVCRCQSWGPRWPAHSPAVPGSGGLLSGVLALLSDSCSSRSGAFPLAHVGLAPKYLHWSGNSNPEREHCFRGQFFACVCVCRLGSDLMPKVSLQNWFSSRTVCDQSMLLLSAYWQEILACFFYLPLQDMLNLKNTFQCEAIPFFQLPCFEFTTDTGHK